MPNAGDLTWAEVSLDPSTLAALPAGLADVPDAQARAVVWVALLGAVYRAEVDPRVVLEVFGAAWPHETSAAVLSRAALATTSRVVPMFLPPAEQEAALAGVATAADVLAERAASIEGADGDALAVVAARVWAGTGSDVDRLRRWADGTGIPAVLDGDDDFRWAVLRRLATLDALSENEIEQAAAADRSLAGSLAALGVRAVRPTAEAKAWAWAALRDDAELSNYAALSVAGGFWVAPDPELVRPYVEQVGDLVPGALGADGRRRRLAGGHRHPSHPAGRRRDGGGIRCPPRVRRPDTRRATGVAGCRPRAARGARQPAPVRPRARCGGPAVSAGRDRDDAGRARQQRPRDALGRPLPYGDAGVEPVPEEALPPAETIETARALVREGRPFAAHEVLEARWKAGPDDERDLWQGLAQLCVGLTHAARGNAVGADRLLERAAGRLDAYAAGGGPSYGLDLAATVACAREQASAAG